MSEAFSDELIKQLIATTEGIDALDNQYAAKEDQLVADFRTHLEPLLHDRQVALDKIDGFWANVLTSGKAPTKKLLNGTTDPKVMRAVTSFRVLTTSSSGGATITRRIVLQLRPNIFVDSKELFREIEMNGDLGGGTADKASGVAWKQGTEKSRSDSILRFFDPKSGASPEWQGEVIDAFDQVFQNPFEFTQA